MQIVLPRSATPDGNDDLQAIAVADCMVAEAAARHDLPVALQGEPLPCESESIQKLCKTDSALELPHFSIDDDGDHC